MRDEQPIEIECQYKTQTPKAVLVTIDDHAHWLPLSQIKFLVCNDPEDFPEKGVLREGERITLLLSHWLAEKNGWVEPEDTL